MVPPRQQPRCQWKKGCRQKPVGSVEVRFFPVGADGAGPYYTLKLEPICSSCLMDHHGFTWVPAGKT